MLSLSFSFSNRKTPIVSLFIVNGPYRFPLMSDDQPMWEIYCLLIMEESRLSDGGRFCNLFQ